MSHYGKVNEYVHILQSSTPFRKINIVISHAYPLCRRDDSPPRRGPRTPSTPREEIHDIAEDYTSDGEIAVSARGGGPRTPPGPGPHTPPGMVILL